MTERRVGVEFEEEISLMYLPQAEGEPKRRHVAALAEALDMETWDAARILASPIPRILCTATAAEIKPIAQALKLAQLPISALETSLLLEDIDEWLVEWLEYADDGKLMMIGADEQVPLPMTQESLLVRGWQMRRSTPYGSLGSKDSGGLRRVQFAHLYLADNPRPFCLVESEIRDYLFLEEEISPSARQNFDRLMEILATAPYMRVETGMLDHPVEVRAAMDGLRSRGAASSSSQGLTLAVIPEHVLSRVYYYNCF